MSFIVNGVGSVGGITPVLVFESLTNGGGGDSGTWESYKHTQTTPFSAGAVVITLPHAPVSIDAIIADYNGQKIYPVDDFTLSGADVTIVFGDSYTDYDADPIFHFQYQY